MFKKSSLYGDILNYEMQLINLLIHKSKLDLKNLKSFIVGK